ncbi:DUF1642 domain-containing protein [Enterococcus faecalis]|uniref:DUF1642 domain-containing protein n=1 Tax=Bacillota TaxID=1239 RepID=UPI000CF24A3A|nr:MULTISPECIES: DUF1642 domain-containing protein [Bacillota]EGO2625201.1 DUF1642 domain-containing protein [Enterococcus faecalis]EGO5143217.1 DUF1642 domain-containing protein [Enterococcus faecalis]EGO5856070.1 DUF1642 domain-containing protein [Enterococcus faecalis]EGO7996288.1 DUF1642 domain-containing protein [Enterococcus faecalis]EGO8138400.1 DUF1642 domain-containing protein [Enterococcus faecalis]
MNKQELIERIDSKMFAYPLMEPETEDDTTVEFKKGFNCACDNIKCLVQQKLDEPKKVVVPKFVAEWIEYAKKKGDSLIVSFNPWDLYGAEYIEATRWIDNNQETFALAWVNGYEVEKEQLYYVKLPGIGYLNNSDGGIKHTEKEIKAIDKRYWPFAVKVDGE